jgi:hypothetical protein
VIWHRGDPSLISISPFTGHQYTVVYGSDLWQVEVTFEPLTRAQAAPWLSFFEKLHGKEGTFLFGDTLQATARGTPSGTPKVKGGSQVGFSLITDGWTPSTLVLKDGDFFQIDSQLYRNLGDATSNGSGEVTLDIWPSLRGHVDNSNLDCTAPKGIFRLITVPSDRAAEDHLYYLDFAAIEARS